MFAQTPFDFDVFFVPVGLNVGGDVDAAEVDKGGDLGFGDHAAIISEVDGDYGGFFEVDDGGFFGASGEEFCDDEEVALYAGFGFGVVEVEVEDF
jgi:hypothetical protein